MKNQEDTYIPYYVDIQSGWAKKMPEYDNHNDSLLPDWFKFGYYEDLVNMDNSAIWAFEFAIRYQFENRQDFLEKTGGVVFESNNITRLMWANGVYQGFTIDDIQDYIDKILIHYLKKNNGVLVPENDRDFDYGVILQTFRNAKIDGIKIQEKGGKSISTTLHSPVKHIYQKIKGETARHEFPDIESYTNYRDVYNKISHKTASFLVNLEVPTNKIIDELKQQITNLKKLRHIRGHTQKNDTYKEWAQSLAVWDLSKAGYKPRIIQNRVLAKWHPKKPSKLGIDSVDKDLQNMYGYRNGTAKKLIESEWIKLAGYPIYKTT